LTYPLPWLSRNLFFKLHHVPNNNQIRYAVFSLTGAAQQGFTRSTKDKQMTTRACFTKGIIRVPDPPIGRDTANDLAPPNGSVNDYTDNFTAYVLHVSTASKLHQITLFITGLQDPL
jgi:hypothetical protein